MIKRTLPLLFFVIGAGAFGADRWIKPGATGDGESADSPMGAFPAQLREGFTYNIWEGTYTVPKIAKPKITIRKWGRGAPAVIEGQITVAADDFTLDGVYRAPDWQSFYGIKVKTPDRKESKGIEANGVSGMKLRYVEVEGAGVDSEVKDRGLFSYGAKGTTISRCAFHDFGQIPFLTGGNEDLTIEECYVARNSSDSARHSEALADEDSDRVTIRRNVFEDIEGTGYLIVLSRGKRGLVSEDWQIYENVFHATALNPAKREGTGNGAIAVINDQVAKNWMIRDNLFALIPPLASRVAMESAGEGSGDIKVERNWWFKCSPATHNGPLDAADNRYIATKNTGREPGSQSLAAAPERVIKIGPYFEYDTETQRLTILASGVSSLPVIDEGQDFRVRTKRAGAFHPLPHEVYEAAPAVLALRPAQP